MVDPAAGRRMLGHLPDCQMVWLDARHELLSELPEVTTRPYGDLTGFWPCSWRNGCYALKGKLF